MRQETYVFEKDGPYIYKFISKGEKQITKIVEFTITGYINVYNLAFGDQLVNDQIDDMVSSNNGDIIKVLATVINICKDFTNSLSGSRIMFTGSTLQRTRMYNRIMRMYYEFFIVDFIIVASSSGHDYVLFDPISDIEYMTFIIRRNKK